MGRRELVKEWLKLLAIHHTANITVFNIEFNITRYVNFYLVYRFSDASIHNFTDIEDLIYWLNHYFVSEELHEL